MLLYNYKRWSPQGNAIYPCLDANDRASVVQSLRAADGLTITVVGAHFPHPGFGTMQPLRDAIGAAGGSKVILIADTNRDYPSSQLMCEINKPFCSDSISTELFASCCTSDGFQYKGFDRILANFGHSMRTEPLFGDLHWSTGEFHRAVIGKFKV